MVSPLLKQLSQTPWWPYAIDRLHERVEQTASTMPLCEYAGVYEGRRAAMVVDVVSSRQRKYGTTVRQIVADFELRHPRTGLSRLGRIGPGGRRPTPAEQETIQRVAGGLARFCAERDVDENEACRLWAAEADPLRLAPRLDPYVGGRGIGVALFAYLRMRSGADALKPDSRVRREMSNLGFESVGDDVALVLVIEAAAEALGLTPFLLDRVLW